MRNVLMTGAIPFILETIGQERLAWLQSLPLRWTDEALSVVHASPHDVWHSPGANASDADLESSYGPLGCEAVVYGHIHHPFVRRLRGFTVANSGSLSFSYDGDPRASYVLIDGEQIAVRRVEYDIEKEVRALSAVRYPDAEWIAQMYRSARPVAPP